MPRCNYRECKFEESKALDGVSLRGGRCIFHATSENKGVTEESFLRRFKTLIDDDFKVFDGIIFPFDIDFNKSNFDLSHCIRFVNAEFHGDVRFDNIVFENPIDFSHAKFFGSFTSFKNTEFKSGVNFINTEFQNGIVFFDRTKFLNNTCKFTRAEFGHDAIFHKNTINCALDFLEMDLGQNSRFYFTEPMFKVESDPIIIRFVRVRFNPSAAHFEQIKFPKSIVNDNLGYYPILMFRFCNLKEAFFANNSMSLFSFFESGYFEEAFFNSNIWSSRNKRKFLLFEDIFFDQLITSVTSKSKKLGKGVFDFIGQDDKEIDDYGVRDLRDFRQIADLYMRFKSSADKAKDYHLASGFYFNEFELKRRHCVGYFKSDNGFKRFFRALIKPRWWLYTIYKLFAGYGEKPLRSFIWLLIAITTYSMIYLFHGVDTANWSVTYEFQASFPLNWEFAKHFFTSALYTITRIIPKSYQIFETSEISIINDSPFIATSNWFVITILLVFIGIGLKRHFRRF